MGLPRINARITRRFLPTASRCPSDTARRPLSIQGYARCRSAQGPALRAFPRRSGLMALRGHRLQPEPIPDPTLQRRLPPSWTRLTFKRKKGAIRGWRLIARRISRLSRYPASLSQRSATNGQAVFMSRVDARFQSERCTATLDIEASDGGLEPPARPLLPCILTGCLTQRAPWTAALGKQTPACVRPPRRSRHSRTEATRHAPPARRAGSRCQCVL